MTIEAQVSGNPVACHRSAGQLADLAAATAHAAANLGHSSMLSTADFGGRSGDAFRGHAASLAERLSTESDRCHLVSQAMAQLAHDLDRVTSMMAEARETARTRRLVVEGGAIHAPGAGADADQHRAWRELRAVVAGIRELEDRAQRDWRRALAGVPLPSAAGAGDRTPVRTPDESAPTTAPDVRAPTAVPASPATAYAHAGSRGGATSPTTWAAEQLGVHAEVWVPPVPAGTWVAEEVLDESR